MVGGGDWWVVVMAVVVVVVVGGGDKLKARSTIIITGKKIWCVVVKLGVTLPQTKFLYFAFCTLCSLPMGVGLQHDLCG